MGMRLGFGKQRKRDAALAPRGSLAPVRRLNLRPPTTDDGEKCPPGSEVRARAGEIWGSPVASLSSSQPVTSDDHLRLAARKPCCYRVLILLDEMQLFREKF
ncbi:hypothetical protein ABZP36_000276 [Zizania latifolia]